MSSLKELINMNVQEILREKRRETTYGRFTSTITYPVATDTIVYPFFNGETYPNTNLFTYVNPLGGPLGSRGFICNKAGLYKCDYSLVCFSSTYSNRVQWHVYTYKNTTMIPGRSWGYTRAQAGGGYVWSCNCSSTFLVEMENGDFIDFQIVVAKNDNSLGDDFSGLGLGGSSTCIFQYLGV